MEVKNLIQLIIGWRLLTPKWKKSRLVGIAFQRRFTLAPFQVLKH
jgi:hypothetical protein